MYKNQLQELAQRSCFSLPSYTCIREGPDHAPRFKASVNFNGEIFESPAYYSTLRQAEHAAAEFALNVLSSRVPSKSLTAKVLDESGIYKNLLQETAHRAGLDLPMYTSVRLGTGHTSAFSCTVELAGMKFTGESAKTKKQAEKNAAIAAWSSLKRMPSLDSMGENEEKEQEVVERVLSRFRPKEVKRREPNQWRRRTFTRTSHPDTNKDLLIERLRWINLLTNQASSSTHKLNKTSFISLNPPLLPPKSSKILSLTTNVQQYNGKSSQEKAHVKEGQCPVVAKPEMLNTKPYESSNSCRTQFNLNPNRLAPPVHIRSMIPVFAAPPPKSKPNPNSSSSASSTSTSSINQLKSTSKLRDDQIKLGLEFKP